jgi:rRNA maturation RNase YbeY
MSTIHFFSEKVKFKLANPRKTRTWIERVAKQEGKELGEINIIFCSDTFLLQLNQSHLNHDTLTDIITFDYTESPKSALSGDIFISIHRVKENAVKFKVPIDSELHRVIIHGVLHLIGYKDKTTSQKSTMRGKEDAYLSLR